MSGDGLWLASSSLLSKWGFNDGGVPDDLYEWLEDRSPPAPGGGWPDLSWLHAVWGETLAALVRGHLLPALDQQVEVYEIGGPHNPVRAERVDGVDVPPEVICDPRAPTPILTPDGVLVPYEVVVEAARRVAGAGRQA